VAGASALADQGARQLRQWRVEAGTDFLPTAGDLSQWTAQSLVGAQARLRRIGLEAPPQLQPDWLSDRTLEALGDTWRSIVHRDLPETAAKAGHFLLRLLADLPIWGAAGWIVYRVADGYVAGQHEGMPFLIDTAILVAAYAFIERAVVLAWIRRQAHQLVQQIQAQVQAQLAATHAQVLLETQALVDERKDALAAVAGAADQWRAAVRDAAD
jgi:hypothetical protein